MKSHFIAGWNMPGYLPEMDPVDFDDFEDARDYVADEIDKTADNAYQTNDTATQNDAENAIDDTNDWNASDGPYWQVYADQYVYWVEEKFEATSTPGWEE